MKRIPNIVSLMLLAGIFISVRTGTAKTLDEIMTTMAKNVDSLTTISGTQVVKFVLQGEMVTAENHFMAKVPDKFRVTTMIPIPGTKKVQEVLTVCNGKTIWQYVMPPEQEKVIKMDLTAMGGKIDQYQKKFMESGYGILDASSLLKYAGIDYDIRVARGKKINKMDMDVIEGKLKAGSTAANAILPTPEIIRYYIGAKDGFIYKIEGLEKGNKLVLEISYTQVTFNEKISDTNFKFKPKKHVEVFAAEEIAPYVPETNAK